MFILADWGELSICLNELMIGSKKFVAFSKGRVSLVKIFYCSICLSFQDKDSAYF
jgi:hypothetical protein